MDTRISVIIPAYNIENYLARTLDSVLAQTYTNLEVIVVNDGSKDGTGAVIDAYAGRDGRIKAIHKENGGVSSARLRGVAEATGDWIGFVDGDDFVEPDMYQRLLDNARIHNAQISHCGYKMVFPSGKIDYYYNSGKLVVQAGQQGCTDLLEGGFVEPGLWNKLYRKELFEGLSDWLDTSIRINEDLLMNFYLFRQVKTAFFEDVCPYHYVLRKGSAATSKVNDHKLRDPLRVLKLLYEETKDVPAWNQIVERRMMYQLVGSSTMSLGKQRKLIKPVRKEARKELRQRLLRTLKSGTCDVKLKIMVLWAAVWPASYGWVHRVYARLTGVDKKYNVE